MDEEDGRLGPRARQSGRVDVLTDAFTTSLCHSNSHISTTRVPQVSLLRAGCYLRTLKFLIQNEEMP